MKRTRFNRQPLRLTPLAACLALVIAAGSATQNAVSATPNTPAQPRPWQSPALHGTRAEHAQSTPHHPATTDEVTSCADDGSPGTLRSVVASAGEGDIVDVGGLLCSKITLLDGEIDIAVNDLTIRGTPGIYLDIDGNESGRIFVGNNLVLDTLQLSGGKYSASGTDALGGCVKGGVVYLKDTIVSHCVADASIDFAAGGAIYAHYAKIINSVISDSSAYSSSLVGGGGVDAVSAYINGSTISDNKAVIQTGGGAFTAYGGGVSVEGGTTYTSTIINSVISGNQAIQPDSGGYAQGGGINAGGLLVLSGSTVSGNSASAENGSSKGAGIHAFALSVAHTTISGNVAQGAASDGGGLFSTYLTVISYTTIDHNRAENNAGLTITHGAAVPAGTLIENSTISGNIASGSSAIFINLPATINNSTIAFNQAAGSSAGLYLYTDGFTDLESTIISNNTSSAGGGFDVVARADITGTHNLILNPGAAVPSGTLTGIDPLLEPLANNGGPTRTQGLLHTSPAIDAGSNPNALTNDQRGTGFSRTFGPATDIGAWEWQGGPDDLIFANGFD